MNLNIKYTIYTQIFEIHKFNFIFLTSIIFVLLHINFANL